jgi:hypothetical protein
LVAHAGIDCVVAAFLLDLIGAADGEASAAAGFRERQAGLNEFLDLLVEMEAQLSVEFALDGVAAEKGSKANQEITQHLHLLESSSMGNYLGRPQHLGDGGRQLLPFALFRFGQFRPLQITSLIEGQEEEHFSGHLNSSDRLCAVVVRLLI